MLTLRYAFPGDPRVMPLRSVRLSRTPESSLRDIFRFALSVAILQGFRASSWMGRCASKHPRRLCDTLKV